MSTLPFIRLCRRALGSGLVFCLGIACAHQEQGELPPGSNSNGVNSSGGGSSAKAGSTSYGGSFSSAGRTSSSGGSGGAAPASGGAGSGGVAPGGSGGTGGTSGSGGSAGSGDPMYVALEGFHVEYQALNTTDSGPYISAELDVVNEGPLSVPIDELSLRYYFTNENSPDVAVMMNWANANTTPYTELSGKVTGSVAIMPEAVTGADSYIEFTFSSGGATLTPGTVLKLSFQLAYNGGAGTFIQADDWSYDASHTSLAEWDHVVLLRSGDFAWGSPPG